MVLSNNIINKYIISSAPYNQQINEQVIFKFPLYTITGMMLFGPFIEELVFRLPFKEKIKSKYLFYIITILLFAGVHVLNGISSLKELVFFIPYGALATSFAYILDKTNNIFSTIIIHTLHNTFSIIVILLVSMLGV